MLKSLYIKNYALIEKLEVAFGSGLNIITGETGSGKSIMIDALALALGDRASSDAARRGAKKAVVEAVFDAVDDTALREILEENDLEDFDEPVLRTEISAKGSSRRFVNDTPSNAAVQKSIGDLLADFHGQHEGRSLLSGSGQLRILDGFARIDEEIRIFKSEKKRLAEAYEEFSEMSSRSDEVKREFENMLFELEQIDKINPKPGELEELEEELKRLENAEELHYLSQNLYRSLYDDDFSARKFLTDAVDSITRLSELDSEFDNFKKECKSALIATDEIAKFALHYSENVVFDPDRIEAIRKRTIELARLEKRYGSVEEAIRRAEELRESVAESENFDEKVRSLADRVDSRRKKLGKIASDISIKRKTAAALLEKEIEKSLAELGVKSPTFKIVLECKSAPDDPLGADVEGGRLKTGVSGIDFCEFLISLNIGEDLKPLKNAASGGEISRIALSIKSAAAIAGNMPVMVFDEIDTGVSGAISQKVGLKMKKLSRLTQILAVTHQAQIAALADSHVVVKKIESEEGSKITAKLLSGEEKTREVAKLISGEDVTESAMKSAEELARID